MPDTGRNTLNLTRRSLIGGAAASLVGGPLASVAWSDTVDDPYPLPSFDYLKMPEAFRPSVLVYKGRQHVGTIIVDTSARQIYLVVDGG